MVTGTVYQQTPALGREVVLRPGTSDRQVWADTFTGRYHLPPGTMTAPRTILDLGANIGLTAAHYKAMWPDADILAVEMDPDCAHLAEVNARGCRVKCCAVSALGGWGWYDTTTRAEAFAFVRGGQGEVKEPLAVVEHYSRRLVSSYTLRQTILRGFPDVREVDFCKMDIEGSEWGILAHGAWAPLVKNLLVELHPDDDHPDDTEDLVNAACLLLADLGFNFDPMKSTHPRGIWATR